MKSPHEQITQIMSLYDAKQDLLAKGCGLSLSTFNKYLKINDKHFRFNQSHVDKLHVYLDVLNLKRKEV